MPVDLQQHVEHHRREEIHGVSYLSAAGSVAAGDDLYLELRIRESRVYPDTMVRSLPSVPSGGRHRAEWKVRARSMRGLIRYLESRQGPITLLDVGCGNGWMANRLARIPGVRVFALDTNRVELGQAARVFGHHPRLMFLYGDLFQDILPPRAFDVVVLAAAAQYFPDLAALFERLAVLLAERGEVHIIDTPFYDERSRPAAQERSRRHFARVGVPAFAGHYHHHLLATALALGCELLYDPRPLSQRLRRRLVSRDLSPFPWLRYVKGRRRGAEQREPADRIDQVSSPGS